MRLRYSKKNNISNHSSNEYRNCKQVLSISLSVHVIMSNHAFYLFPQHGGGGGGGGAQAGAEAGHTFIQ